MTPEKIYLSEDEYDYKEIDIHWREFRKSSSDIEYTRSDKADKMKEFSDIEILILKEANLTKDELFLYLLIKEFKHNLRHRPDAEQGIASGWLWGRAQLKDK